MVSLQNFGSDIQPSGLGLRKLKKAGKGCREGSGKGVWNESRKGSQMENGTDREKGRRKESSKELRSEVAAWKGWIDKIVPKYNILGNSTTSLLLS